MNERIEKLALETKLIKPRREPVPHDEVSKRAWAAVKPSFDYYHEMMGTKPEPFNDRLQAFAEALIKDVCKGMYLSEAQRIYKRYGMELKPVMSKLSKYGDHMTADEFETNMKHGVFIPDDGSGNWATETEESDWSVWSFDRPKWATHVMWYNK